MTAEIRNNTALRRFELDVGDGQIAVAYYQLAPRVITFTHTEVPSADEGHGIGSQLVRHALDDA